MSTPDFEKLEELGVYHPRAADASVQRTLLTMLAERGMSNDEMVTAYRENRLYTEPMEREIVPIRDLSAADLADRGGLSVDKLRAYLRAWGLVDAGPDDRTWNEDDLELVRYVVEFEPLVGEAAALRTARAMGLALAQVAEAEVAVLRSTYEVGQRHSGASDDEVIRSYRGLVGPLIDQAEGVHRRVHRHHLVQATRRYSSWNMLPSELSTMQLAVGFIDLSDSTQFGEKIDMATLGRALDHFESIVSDVAATRGISIVKRTGDGALYVAPSLGVTCRSSLEMVERCSREPDIPAARAAFTVGEVLARGGDVFGSQVNLAARLLTVADPGTVVTTVEARARLLGAIEDVSFLDLGSYRLAGFEDLVRAFVVERS